jgi:DNA-binding transcriptional LysR family regulator
MVTRHVAELEQWLGARLLQRTTRQVTLTDAGENCLRRCQQMLALADSLQEETEQRGDSLRGLLRVTCSVSLAHSQLAAMLVRLSEPTPAAEDRPQRQRGA